MFLLNLNGPQIAFNSSGGGGGGGGSSSSSSSTVRPKARPKPAPKPAPKPKPASTSGGKGSTPKSTSKGRNLDADMFAGSTYKKNPTTGNYSSPTSVTAKDLKSGNVSTFKSKTGSGSVTVKRGTKLKDVPTVNVGVDGKKTVSNTDAYDSKDVATPPKAPAVTNDPVTAPEVTEPEKGVGGGRNGGASAKRKASAADEDKLKIKRKAQGVKGYKRDANANPMAIKREKS